MREFGFEGLQIPRSEIPRPLRITPNLPFIGIQDHVRSGLTIT